MWSKEEFRIGLALVVENYFRLTKQRLTPTEKNSSIFDREKECNFVCKFKNGKLLKFLV